MGRSQEPAARRGITSRHVTSRHVTSRHVPGLSLSLPSPLISSHIGRTTGFEQPVHPRGLDTGHDQRPRRLRLPIIPSHLTSSAVQRSARVELLPWTDCAPTMQSNPVHPHGDTGHDQRPRRLRLRIPLISPHLISSHLISHRAQCSAVQCTSGTPRIDRLRTNDAEQPVHPHGGDAGQRAPNPQTLPQSPTQCLFFFFFFFFSGIPGVIRSSLGRRFCASREKRSRIRDSWGCGQAGGLSVVRSVVRVVRVRIGERHGASPR